MDRRSFDTWVRQIATGQNGRRAVLHTLVGAALGSLTGHLSLTAEAKKRRKKRKKKKKVTFNAFGCVDVGKFCKSDDQCCSGICEGKKGKNLQTCQAHDQSTCQAGQTINDCGGTDVACTTSSGGEGGCFTTTGNGAFCGVEGSAGCAICAKDADCEAVFGPGAACVPCVVCADEGGTACVPPDDLGKE